MRLASGQNLPQHDVHHGKHPGQVEGTLEGRALAGGLRGLAVAAQIAEPLAVFRIGEEGLGVIQYIRAIPSNLS